MSKLRGQGRKWDQLTNNGTYETANNGNEVTLRDQNGEEIGQFEWSTADNAYRMTQYDPPFGEDDIVVMTVQCFQTDTHQQCIWWSFSIIKYEGGVIMEVPEVVDSGLFQYDNG